MPPLHVLKRGAYAVNVWKYPSTAFMIGLWKTASNMERNTDVSFATANPQSCF